VKDTASPRTRVSSRAAKASRAGTGCWSAAGVETMRSWALRAASWAPDRVRRARSLERTVRRSLEAAKASRMSRLSGWDSGKTRTLSGQALGAAAWKKATSSASCSAIFSSSATTSHAAAGWRRTRAASTAPRATGQMPVSLWSIGEGAVMTEIGNGRAATAGPERGDRADGLGGKFSAQRVEGGVGGGFLGGLLGGPAALAEWTIQKIDLCKIAAVVVRAFGASHRVTDGVVAVHRLGEFLEATFSDCGYSPTVCDRAGRSPKIRSMT